MYVHVIMCILLFYAVPFVFLRWHLHDPRADSTMRAYRPCQRMKNQTYPLGHRKAQAQDPFAFAKPEKSPE